MSEKVQITIIGAGVIGCAVACQLSQQYDEIFVFEQNDKIKAENQSSRNSGVIHAGVYYPKDIAPLKAKLCVEGNRLLYDFCEELDVPFARVGKLIVAVQEHELEYLEDTFRIAVENKVPGAKLITAEEAKQMEPNIQCHQAAHFPTSGIVEATSLVYQLYSQASQKDVFFLTGTKVVDIKPRRAGFEVTTDSRGNREIFETELLINAAGLFADEIARMVNPDFPYHVKPVRGEAAKFYKQRRSEINHHGMNIYPVPCPVNLKGVKEFMPFKEFQRLFEAGKLLKTTGVHLTPTFDIIDAKYEIGNLVTIGPLYSGVVEKDDYFNGLLPEENFLKEVNHFFPHLKLEDIGLHQTGIQAKLNEQFDFVIEKDEKFPNCINLVGIDSPGLTACLAIARYVAEMIN